MMYHIEYYTQPHNIYYKIKYWLKEIKYLSVASYIPSYMLRYLFWIFMFSFFFGLPCHQAFGFIFVKVYLNTHFIFKFTYIRIKNGGCICDQSKYWTVHTAHITNYLYRNQ